MIPFKSKLAQLHQAYNKHVPVGPKWLPRTHPEIHPHLQQCSCGCWLWVPSSGPAELLNSYITPAEVALNNPRIIPSLRAYFDKHLPTMVSGHCTQWSRIETALREMRRRG